MEKVNNPINIYMGRHAARSLVKYMGVHTYKDLVYGQTIDVDQGTTLKKSQVDKHEVWTLSGHPFHVQKTLLRCLDLASTASPTLRESTVGLFKSARKHAHLAYIDGKLTPTDALTDGGSPEVASKLKTGVAMFST